MLKAGDRVVIDAHPYRVKFVNFSRAYCVPLAKRTVQIGGRHFKVEPKGVSISPNSPREAEMDGPR